MCRPTIAFPNKTGWIFSGRDVHVRPEAILRKAELDRVRRFEEVVNSGNPAVDVLECGYTMAAVVPAGV